MRAIAATALMVLASTAVAKPLVYQPTVGTGGGTVVTRSDGVSSVVAPGVNGGFTIFNGDKSVTTVVPLPGVATRSTAAEGGILTAGRTSGGVVADGAFFRTLAAPGIGFCAPPCALTADGVAPDGSVITVEP
jgi:hypothetical protein